MLQPTWPGAAVSNPLDPENQCRIYHRASWARAQGPRSRGPKMKKAKQKRNEKKRKEKKAKETEKGTKKNRIKVGSIIV